MTPDELTAIARRVFPLLPHPTKPDEPWWTQGEMCGENKRWCPQSYAATFLTFAGPHSTVPHAIPPPNPLDWGLFGQLLMTVKGAVSYSLKGDGDWFAEVGDEEEWAADPREAPILAVAKMLRVVK